jgi:UDPglucose 6-dehydrogenase
VRADVTSAEMIMYASNAFLATKISFITEIANVCEEVGADVTLVAGGMGLDKPSDLSSSEPALGTGARASPRTWRHSSSWPATRVITFSS